MPKEKKVYESRRLATARWKKENTRQVKFNFNIHTEADILEFLDSLPNKQGFIKELIRREIANKK